MNNRNIDQILSRLEKLETAVFTKKNEKKVKKQTFESLNFSLNIRAFAKRYGTGSSGPKKFVLLVAYLAKGDLANNIDLGTIKKEWDKMSAKTMLGKFNRFYSSEAKNQGWVDSREYGTYCLTDEWQSSL